MLPARWPDGDLHILPEVIQKLQQSTIAMEEIEGFVKTKGLSAQFMQIPEAREYRQTLAMRQDSKKVSHRSEKTFPEELFTISV